jgi:hypothetical protein
MSPDIFVFFLVLIRFLLLPFFFFVNQTGAVSLERFFSWRPKIVYNLPSKYTMYSRPRPLNLEFLYVQARVSLSFWCWNVLRIH